MTKTELEKYQPRETSQLIIIGAGGHAVSVANVARSAGFNICHFVDPKKEGQKLLNISIIGSIDVLKNKRDFNFSIALGDNSSREKIYNEITRGFGKISFPAIVHSSAVIGEFSRLGQGTVVMPKAVVGPNSTVGHFCLINTHASIDHDCLMHHFSSLAPGAITGGSVEIGVRSAVSIGAVIKHGIKIGDDCVVGANSYVNTDLPNNLVAYGTPARHVRSRSIGDPYLG